MGRIFVPEKNIVTRVETNYTIYNLHQRKKDVWKTQRMACLELLVVDNIEPV
jgi:hypothetical protein